MVHVQIRSANFCSTSARNIMLRFLRESFLAHYPSLITCWPADDCVVVRPSWLSSSYPAGEGDILTSLESSKRLFSMSRGGSRIIFVGPELCSTCVCLFGSATFGIHPELVGRYPVAVDSNDRSQRDLCTLLNRSQHTTEMQSKDRKRLT
jgi:hypothetical protein